MNKLDVKALWCLIIVIVPFGAHAADGLVLWNTLDSTTEVLNSAFGPNFETVEDGGDVLFVNGEFGGALATTGGTANLGPAGGYLVMNPDDFFPTDKTRGTVEMWIQKQVQALIPYQSSLVTFFGRSRYATGYLSIGASWEDGLYNTPRGLNSVNFRVYDGDWHSAIDYGWDTVPVGQWVHLAFVWDGAGIEAGPDDLRIYRDGVLVANHQGRFNQVVPYCCEGYRCDESICPTGYEVRVLANHEGRRMTGCPENTSGYCPSAYMDNIIVWDYAKTDFSDRFNESPIASKIGGSITGIIPDTVNCLNQSTGQNVTIEFKTGSTIWDCEAEGLIVNPEDHIIMTVEGSVPREFDFNSDGCIDLTDVQRVITEARHAEPRNPIFDVNGDGVVNIVDARALVLIADNPSAAPCN
jgi:hypothetical protein